MSNINDKIISFEEYRRKILGSKYKPDIFSIEFEKGLSDQSELLEWYIFNRHFSKHRLFLHSLLKDNETRGVNPSAGFILAYSESDLNDNISSLIEAASRANKRVATLNFINQSYIKACSEITFNQASTNFKAFKAIENEILNTDKIILVAGLSKLKTKLNKTGLARDMIKVIDDKWLTDGSKPNSTIIFIDYPQFLQKSWSKIGSYLNVLG